MRTGTWISVRSSIDNRFKLLALMASLAGAANAATMAPGVQQKLSNATFEVVLAKPVADPLTYEKPLPLELLSYRERTDKFRSVGTAFAIGPNRFVSAAHVIISGNASLYGQLALRTASGKTYQIDKIIKYSSSEDYAVFSLVAPPAVVPLETRSRPPLNTAVFAVGNALGDGVVARDGLYTSDTPEELDGRWQWIRFSAAASPGNSGGPLIDRNGKVVGVILRKSPSENLNFALAIGQVLDGGEADGLIEGRSSYRIAVMKAADSVSIKEKFPLPKTLDQFYAAVLKVSTDWAAKIHSNFLKNHADEIFPRGNSDQLLATVYAEAFPKLISISDGGTWALIGDSPKKVELEKNGYLQEGVSNNIFFVRLKAPDGMNSPTLVNDSKQFMDFLLKGYPLARPVGTDSVRVTSMGKATEDTWFTDEYHRQWQVRSWSVPFNDTYLVTIALPTPDGAVMMMAQTPSSLRGIMTREMEGICNFAYVSYTGTLMQWQTFLADIKNLPPLLSDIEFQWNYDIGLGLKSSRFQQHVPPGVLRVSDASVMMLKFSFMRDGANTVWDLGGVYLADSEQKLKWVGVLRRSKPSPSMPEDLVRLWGTMTTGKHPWDAVPVETGGRTEINTVIDRKSMAAGKTVGYSLSLNEEGTQPTPKMKEDFKQLQGGFTSYE